MSRSKMTQLTSEKIAAIDPGGTTGVVWGVRVGDRFEIEGFEEVKLGVSPIIHSVNGLISYGVRVLIIEDFVVYEHAAQHLIGAKSSTGLAPVFVMGVIHTALAYEGCDPVVGGYLSPIQVVYQMKAQANVIDDARLRALGGWIRGKPHCRDAYRHAALYCRKFPAA